MTVFSSMKFSSMKTKIMGAKPKKIKKQRKTVVIKFTDRELYLPETEWPPGFSIEETDKDVSLNLKLKYHGEPDFVPNRGRKGKSGASAR